MKHQLSFQSKQLSLIHWIIWETGNHPKTKRRTLSSSSHCRWSGVGCNSNGLVQNLNLSHMNLSGRVGNAIQELTSLINLNLSCNDFASPFPNSLSNLTSLEAIDLSQNYFIDAFPTGLGMAPRLAAVNASGNNFSGSLPIDLSNSTLLKTLNLHHR